LQINYGTMDVHDAQRSMRLFASQVMPEFLDAGKKPSVREPQPLAQAR
jgi:hypothetical protein